MPEAGHWWDHVSLANAILGMVFGVFFPALALGAVRLSFRTRDLVKDYTKLDEKVTEYQGRVFNRFEALEGRVAAMEKLAARVAALQVAFDLRVEKEDESTERNDTAHRRIEDKIDAGDAAQERRIEAAAAQRRLEIKTLKDDLIREFRNTNGNSAH